MRRPSPKRLTSSPFVTLALSACASTASPEGMTVDTRFVAPKGLLDTVTKVTIDVYDASAEVTCDPAKGTTTAKPETPKVTSKELSRTGCAPGVAYCGDLRVTQGDADRHFVALATDGTGELIARGCATTKVTTDSVPLEIKLVRAIAPSTCGNGAIEGLEQCETPNANGCSATCTTVEAHLSAGVTAAATRTGAAGEKTDVAALWREGPAGRFFGFFSDTSGPSPDVGVRVLDASFANVTSPAVAASGFVFLPNGSAPAAPAPRPQSAPRATTLGRSVWTTFQVDSATPENGLDVAVRSFDETTLAPGEATPVVVNGASGEAGAQKLPAIAAGENGKLFVTWQDESGGPGSGRVFGRILTPPSTLGNQQELSTGTANARPRVAATPGGFVIVWESGGDIKLRVVSLDGTPAGGELVVNEKTAGVQERPDIAALPDGRFAVVWGDRASGTSDIVMQRYTAQVGRVPGDQASPLNDLVKDGDQTSPAIAATAQKAGVFLVAWADVPRGDVRARFARTGGGYPFNTVDGSDSEFAVGTAPGRKRAAPSVAIGGKDPLAAIVWEDRATPTPGIYGRRIPVPAK
ncbi:MAG: hypothetical protein IPK71_19080 [Myxococcales bacterium]|nr:hypothetical protein [Myxococcales bacterium]